MYKIIAIFSVIYFVNFGVFAKQNDNVKLSKIKTKVTKVENIKNIDLTTDLTLTDLEVLRFQEIMKTSRGTMYKRGEANPYFVLAAEATTDRERDRFVRLLLEAEAAHVERVGKVLKSQERVQLLMFGDKPIMFDVQSEYHQEKSFPFSKEKAPQSPSQEHRATLYVNVENCSECISAFKMLNNQRLAGVIDGIDVYFEDVLGSDEPIMKWARLNQLSPKMVSAGVITLNHSNGRNESGKVPAIL